MALKSLVLLIAVLSVLTLSSSHPDGGGIAVYWGQDGRETDLKTTCDTGKYKIVNLAFLNVFGAGRTPAWNFAGHCDNGAMKKCTELESEVKHCQEKGIKVFLSIGGDPNYSNYSLSSAEDAKEVASYLFNNFLSEEYGPLGRVRLDGIDLDIEATEDHWDDLVKELDYLRQSSVNFFYISAAPQCPIPVYYLGKAIQTNLIDYLFVQFYNNPDCSASNDNVQPLLDSWDKWVNIVPFPAKHLLFMGLPASPSAAWTGYVEPVDLNTKVLPHIKQAYNYEGVMLWNRYQDLLYGYSDNILPNVLKPVLRSVTSL